MKISFTLATNADPDEMLHYVALHFCFRCLPKYPFRGLIASKIKQCLLSQNAF